jgi:hypothetical protein
MVTRRRRTAAIALVGGFAAGGLLVFGACVGETPSDCLSHFNCAAPADGAADGYAVEDASMADALSEASDTTQETSVEGRGPDGALVEDGGDRGEAGAAPDAVADTGGGLDGPVCDPGKSPHDEACVVDGVDGPASQTGLSQAVLGL